MKVDCCGLMRGAGVSTAFLLSVCLSLSLSLSLSVACRHCRRQSLTLSRFFLSQGFCSYTAETCIADLITWKSVYALTLIPIVKYFHDAFLANNAEPIHQNLRFYKLSNDTKHRIHTFEAATGDLFLYACIEQNKSKAVWAYRMEKYSSRKGSLGRRIVFRFPIQARRFPSLYSVQTGPSAHPCSY